MFLLLDSTNRIADVTASARYVKRQENGVIVGCEKTEADAIYSSGTDRFYPLRPIDFVSEAYSLVWVEEIPEGVVPKFYHYYGGEFYITDEDRAELQKPTPEETIAAVENQVTDLQLALCDFYESVVV